MVGTTAHFSIPGYQAQGCGGLFRIAFQGVLKQPSLMLRDSSVNRVDHSTGAFRHLICIASRNPKCYIGLKMLNGFKAG